MQRVNIEMSLRVYDGFLEQCHQTSREFAILKNGLILRRKKKGRFERFVKIECTHEEAEKLLLLAVKSYPEVVKDIATGIITALKSD
jgi:hypothetical protein